MTRVETICLAAALFLISFSSSSKMDAQSCPGDCSGDRKVTINELIVCVGIALGTVPPEACLACDPEGDGTVTIKDLVATVSVALGQFAVTVSGTCERPGAEGLESCTEGTRVEISRCDDRARCFDNPNARTLLGVVQARAAGTFSITVPGCEVAGALLLFEAQVDQNTGTKYRLIDFGPVGPRSDDKVGSLGRRRIVLEVEITPISEAAVRLLEEVGLENFDDAGVVEIIAAVEQANEQTALAGITADVAADLATETAREDEGVQDAIRNNQLPPATPVFSPQPTMTMTPVVTPTRTPMLLLQRNPGSSP